MIVGLPGGATLAALILCWLGATASAGRHARPGRWARLATRLYGAVSLGRHQ
jgi:hypothetical protein